MNRRDFFRRSAGTAAIPLAAGVAALLPTQAPAMDADARLADATSVREFRIGMYEAFAGADTKAQALPRRELLDDGQYAYIDADNVRWVYRFDSDAEREAMIACGMFDHPPSDVAIRAEWRVAPSIKFEA